MPDQWMMIWSSMTSLALPLGPKDTLYATSIYYTHQFGDDTSILIGKINAVDLWPMILSSEAGASIASPAHRLSFLPPRLRHQ